jgi:uncharacterized membrane protein (DUF485 family)
MWSVLRDVAELRAPLWLMVVYVSVIVVASLAPSIATTQVALAVLVGTILGGVLKEIDRYGGDV